MWQMHGLTSVVFQVWSQIKNFKIRVQKELLGTALARHLVKTLEAPLYKKA